MSTPYRRLRAAKQIPGQVNPVRDPYQPSDNEVWCQLHATPETFVHDSFQSRDIEPNIREIYGALKDTGEEATAAYCFAGPAYNAASARSGWPRKTSSSPSWSLPSSTPTRKSPARPA